MKSVFGIVLILALANSLHAQQEKITGTVVDHQTGEPLAGATIKHPSSGIEVITDLDGFFSISAPIQGVNELTVSYVSYKQMKLNRVIVREGEATKLNIKMRRLGDNHPQSSFLASRDNQPQA